MTPQGRTSWRSAAGAATLVAGLGLVGVGELRGQGASPDESARGSRPVATARQASGEALGEVKIQAARSATDVQGPSWEGSVVVRHGHLVIRSESARRVHVAPGFPWKNLAPGSKSTDNQVEALRARGQVKVSYSTLFMMADEALYEPSRGHLTVRGQVQIRRGEERLSGREAVLELNGERLTVSAAQGRLEVPRAAPEPDAED